MPWFLFHDILLWLGLLVQYQTQVLEVDILDLFPIFREKHSVFYYYCISCRYFVGDLYQVEDVFFHSYFVQNFYYELILIFGKYFFSETVFFLLYTMNKVVTLIDFSNMKPTLQSQNKLYFVIMWVFLYLDADLIS